jgi:hypothetical protein
MTMKFMLKAMFLEWVGFALAIRSLLNNRTFSRVTSQNFEPTKKKTHIPDMRDTKCSPKIETQ